MPEVLGVTEALAVPVELAVPDSLDVEVTLALELRLGEPDELRDPVCEGVGVTDGLHTVFLAVTTMLPYAATGSHAKPSGLEKAPRATPKPGVGVWAASP